VEPHAQPAAPATVAVTSPSADFPPQAVKLLQAAWPIKGQTISWDPAGAESRTTSKSYNEYWRKLSYKATSAAGSYELQLKITPGRMPVANSWRVDTVVNRDGTFGAANVQDGGRSIVNIVLLGTSKLHLEEQEVRRVASPDTVRELYRFAVDDGMTIEPGR
jgi:hypothetical protein